MTTALEKIRTIQFEYTKLIKQLECPIEYHKNIEQVFRLFLPSGNPIKFLDALSCCNDLFISPNNTNVSWDEMIEFFKQKFNDRVFIGMLKQLWPNWNQHNSYNYRFSKIVNCFEIPIPNKIYKTLGLSDNNIIKYGLYLSCKNNFSTNSKAIKDDRYIFFFDNELSDEQKIHISTLSNIVYEIYIDIYNEQYGNYNFSTVEQKKDCIAIESTIEHILSAPLKNIDYKGDSRSTLAKYVYNFSNNNPKFKDRFGKVLNKTMFMRFIQLCIGHSVIRKNNVYGINGKLIGEVQLKTKKRNLTPDIKNNASIPFNNPFPDLYFEDTIIDDSHSVLEGVYNSDEYDYNDNSDDINEDDNPDVDDNIINDQESTNELDNTVNINSILQEEIIQSLAPDKVKAIRSAVDSRRYVRSPIDSNCIPNSILFKFLEHVYKDSVLKHAFCWCCVATGINWHRLERLIVSIDLSKANDGNVILDPDSGFLHYRLINGATYFKDVMPEPSHSYNSFTLALPQNIIEAIVNSSAEKPFTDIRKTLKSNENYYFKKYGGVKPTPEKLNYTFSRQISRHGLTPTEQRFISGNFSYSHKAISKYRRLNLDTINSKYTLCLKRYIEHTCNELELEQNENIFPTKIKNSCPSGSSGSLITQPISLFKNIINAFYASELSQIGGKAQTRQERINKIQHQQAYYYLLQQLLLILRPVGIGSCIAIMKHYDECVISQKNSPKYKERILSPTPKILLEQAKKCESDMNNFITYFNKIGYVIHTPNSKHSSMPLCLRTDDINNEIVMEVMTGSDFQNYINFKKYGKHLNNIKNHNIYRHFSYTYLSNKLSEEFLSEIANHHIDSLDLFSKYSTVDFRDYKAVASILDMLAKKLNIKVI